MKYIGAHVSISGGVENAPLNASKIGASAFAMFTKNQRQWNSRPLTQSNIDLFKKNLDQSTIKPEHVLVHDGYLINLGNSDKEKRLKSLNAFIDEVQRVEQLGLTLLNFHPGSHLKEISEDKCIGLIAEGINQAIAESDYATLVIENVAGQGTNMGHTFEQIAQIIEAVKDQNRIGVCLDTCHLFSSGYDISTLEKFDKVLDKFDTIIGNNFLKGMHLNDSKVPLDSRVDRHESIGKGTIGIEAFKFIMSNDAFNNIPLVLETPNSDLWTTEIETLKALETK